RRVQRVDPRPIGIFLFKLFGLHVTGALRIVNCDGSPLPYRVLKTQNPDRELDLDGGCIYLFGGKRTGPPLLGAVRRNSAHRGVDDSVESVRYCALPALQRT